MRTLRFDGEGLLETCFGRGPRRTAASPAAAPPCIRRGEGARISGRANNPSLSAKSEKGPCGPFLIWKSGGLINRCSTARISSSTRAVDGT